jgi:hypothetical protein
MLNLRYHLLQIVCIMVTQVFQNCVMTSYTWQRNSGLLSQQTFSVSFCYLSSDQSMSCSKLVKKRKEGGHYLLLLRKVTARPGFGSQNGNEFVSSEPRVGPTQLSVLQVFSEHKVERTAFSPLPLYAFVAWCLDTGRNLHLPLTFKKGLLEIALQWRPQAKFYFSMDLMFIYSYAPCARPLNEH